MKQIAPFPFACPRLALRLVAGLAVAAVAMPAQAQRLSPANAAGLTKSEAILGGAPSRLASIRSAQSNGGAAARSPFARRASASYRTAAVNFAAISYARPNLAASIERPDVFNSVALAISASPLDKRWNQVSSGAVAGQAATFAASLRGKVERARIDAVNTYVNAHVAFVADSRQYGGADRWSAASDTLARGRGDCEDFALAKMAMLRKAGFADKDLYFVVLKDLVRRADHAVLVVRSGGRFLVLDNGTNRLLDSAEVDEYRPILTFTAGKRFTHGYRRNSVSAPLVMASVSRVPVPSAVATPANGMPSSPYPAR